jgi:uncharacterized protein (DUF2267 family)
MPAALICDVAERIGGASEKQAQAALVAVLEALGAKLPCDDANVVAGALPEQLRAHLAQPSQPDMSLEEMIALVREREHVPQGFALEHAQAVCAAIAAALDEQGRAQLRIHVWPELTRPSLRDLPIRVPQRVGHKLSDGRMGSEHPIAEASGFDHVQSHSVVREDNPHGARKLSSGG